MIRRCILHIMCSCKLYEEIRRLRKALELIRDTCCEGCARVAIETLKEEVL